MIRRLCAAMVLFFAAGGAAHAQVQDTYTIRGIAVDETAESVLEAQQLAFASAKLIGARQMIARITLPEDRRAAEDLVIDQAIADALSAAVDVEEETRGAGRYRGSLAVVFNPVQVRSFLNAQSIPFTDVNAPTALVVPVASSSIAFDWAEVWPDQSQGFLARTVTSRSFGYNRDSEWDDLSADVSIYGAQRAVIADLGGVEGAYYATVTVVTAAGRRTLGRTQRVATLEDAVLATGAVLDAAWKESAIIRETGRTMVKATVFYTSLAEWNTLRAALAQSPLVSDFQTEAVARDGAVVRFIFAGDGQRLTSDLRDRGVVISAEPIGWVLRSAVTGIR
ncbi:MAG: hypothetical protein QNI84_06140 [Henriciella sp.]|nr:hypothetical protein [Henriciella sp.]